MRILPLLLIAIAIMLCGCGDKRSSPSTQADSNALAQKNVILTKALTAQTLVINTQSTDLRAAQERLANAQANVALANTELHAAQQNVAVVKKNNAAKWRAVFEWVGTVVMVLGGALWIFIYIEKWPVKFLATLVVCIGGGLIVCGWIYYAIEVYCVYIIGGAVTILGATGYYYFHTHTSLLGTVIGNIVLRAGDLGKAALLAAKRFGAGFEK